MSLLKVVNYPAPVLLTVGKPVEEFDEKLKTFVNDMFETMYFANGVGLAAPQVAVSSRIFVMDCSGGDDDSQKIAAINPEVIYTEGSQTGDEGCLSFPDIFIPITRNNRAILRAQDVNGNWFEFDGIELAARCILHETDHCDGIVFLDRMTVLKREMAKRKIKQLQKTGKWD